MSFILDALKKLDQKRHEGSVPDLMTVHPPEGGLKIRMLLHRLMLSSIMN
jgi:hypothetical protein